MVNELEPEMKPIRNQAVLCAFALYSSMTHADMPKIDWNLEDAIRQIDQQAQNFESAMARVSIVAKGPDGAAMESIAGDGFINEDGDMRYNQDGGNRVVVAFPHTGEALRTQNLRKRVDAELLEPAAWRAQ